MSRKFNAPKPKKNGNLYQMYINFEELNKLRVKFKNRVKAIERESSDLEPWIPQEFLDVTRKIDDDNRKSLVAAAKAVNNDLYDWLSSIRGLGAFGEISKVIALIDDISKFPTVSHLWSYAGYGLHDYWQDENGKIVAPVVGALAIDEDGNIELPMPGDLATTRTDTRVRFRPHPKESWRKVRCIDRYIKGFAAPYNKKLKSSLYVLADNSFIRQQTPVYVDVYYSEKERQAHLHPELSAMHLHRRAMRKMIKIFLQHLWLQWRTFEGLPISDPYVADVLGHTHIVRP